MGLMRAVDKSDFNDAIKEFDAELDGQGMIFAGRVAEIGVNYELKGHFLKDYIDYTSGVTRISKKELLQMIKDRRVK